MRFLRKNDIKKTVLVISDIHLGAGPFVNDKVNFLEDFHYDRELVEFFQYYSQNDYLNREVEIVINGDFLDFLAVPFGDFFDDEFWSEEASLKRLDFILKAHKEVIDALGSFLTVKKKSVVYIIGNHDAEFVFESTREKFQQALPDEAKKHFRFIVDNKIEYRPVEGVLIKHGHEYELSHMYDPIESVAVDDEGKRYFIPPWGSYYVTRVVNKFKEENGYINAVRPIKRFLINGLIYDTMFTIRFIVHSFYYFVMVRLMFLRREENSMKKTLELALKEMELFQDYRDVAYSFLNENKDVKALIVGHTHEPTMTTYANGKIFINTGTWTDMYDLDFKRSTEGNDLTYAQIDVLDLKETKRKKDLYGHLDMRLKKWLGTNTNPFKDYN